MQVTNDRIRSYLLHRVGEKRLEAWSPQLQQRGLELNRPEIDLESSFGNATLSAYVGFVDLAGFSTAVRGKTPQQIVNYLRPFLSKLIGLIRGRGALVDKTIGDEVMFVLPKIDEDNGDEILSLGQLMGGMHNLAFTLAGAYPFRIGLSYGEVSFFRIAGSGYEEWTTVGEPVHVAKRLHQLDALASPQPVVGAFGMRVSDDTRQEVETFMLNRLAFFAGFASQFEHGLLKSADFKGVGEVLYAILSPRPDRVPSAPISDEVRESGAS